MSAAGEDVANGKVFLGGLNYESTEDSIKAHFEDNFGQARAGRRHTHAAPPAEAVRRSRAGF